MFCKKCGTEQKNNEKFCGKCGTQYQVLNTDITNSLEEKENISSTESQQDQAEIESTMEQNSSDTSNGIVQKEVAQSQECINEETINEATEDKDKKNTQTTDSESIIVPKKHLNIMIIAGICGALEWFFYDGNISEWGRNLFLFSTACYIITKKTSIFARSSTATKNIIIAFACLNLLVFLSNGGLKGGGYDSDGYNYVLSTLKAPTSATLLEYIPKDELREEVKEKTNLTIPRKLEFECYTIEAQNDFGGRLKKDFVVFFWKGKPIHMEEDGLDSFQSQTSWRHTLSAIKYNTGIDVDE